MRGLRDVGIRWQTGLFLGLLLALILLQLAGVWWFLDAQSEDGSAINEAGEQRMLVQKIAWDAHLVGMGHEDRESELIEAATEFNQTLDALISGNESRGLQEAPSDVREQLISVQTAWNPFHEHVQTLVSEPRSSEAFEESLAYIETHHPTLRDEADEAVTLYEQAFNQKVTQFQLFISGVFLFFLITIPVLFVVIDRHIVNPINRMANETRSIAAGEFDKHISPVHTDDEVGTLARSIQAMKDQLVESLENEKRFREGVLHGGHAITITDKDHTIEFVNPTFEETTNYRAKEAEGKSLELLRSDHHSEAYFEEICDTLNQGEVWEDEEMFAKRQTGELFIADITIAPILTNDETIEGFVSVMADRTEERVQSQQNQVLSRVLRHNLRNELNLIDGYAHNLLQAEDDKHRTQLVEQIHESINTLIEKSKTAEQATQEIEQGGRYRSSHVCAVIERVCDRLEDRFPQANIETELSHRDFTIPLDIGRVIKELVENAIIHNNRDTPYVSVHVDGSTDENAGSVVQITIEDDGPGIPDEERAVIEEGRETPLMHGSGLGLWFVYWVVILGGGEIAISDRRPSGTTVSLTLPCTSVSTPDNSSEDVGPDRNYHTGKVDDE